MFNRKLKADLAAANERIKELEELLAGHQVAPGQGAQMMQTHYGLSRDAFTVLPRVAVEAMSDDWQYRLARLLGEMNDTFPHIPDGYILRGIGPKGRMGKLPEALTNYRHPDAAEIAKWRWGDDCGTVIPHGLFLKLMGIHSGQSMANCAEYLHDATDGLIYGHPDFAWDAEAAQQLGEEMRNSN